MSDASLKRRRGTVKAAVMRFINQIGQAMDQNEAEDVRTKLEALSDAVTKFKEAHEQYHATIDDDDKDASTGYLTSVIRDVQDQRDAVIGWSAAISTSDKSTTSFRCKKTFTCRCPRCS